MSKQIEIDNRALKEVDKFSAEVQVKITAIFDILYKGQLRVL